MTCFTNKELHHAVARLIRSRPVFIPRQNGAKFNKSLGERSQSQCWMRLHAQSHSSAQTRLENSHRGRKEETQLPVVDPARHRRRTRTLQSKSTHFYLQSELSSDEHGCVYELTEQWVGRCSAIWTLNWFVTISTNTFNPKTRRITHTYTERERLLYRLFYAFIKCATITTQAQGHAAPDK